MVSDGNGGGEVIDMVDIPARVSEMRDKAMSRNTIMIARIPESDCVVFFAGFWFNQRLLL